MLIQRTVRLLIGVLLLFPLALSAQVTSSSISGIVRAGAGEGLVGATITATHLPTGTVYTVATRTGGRYNLYNMNPGGPYRIVASFVGYENQTREDIQLTLGENATQDFNMSDKASTLSEVVVAASRTRTSGAKGGSETNISRTKMANLPSVGRNLNDYIRFTPQVKITANGGFSLAGQNNRYNSFLIDGAVNNDVFGLSEAGTNGGRSGAPPISIDAIDQIVVQLSPYDASLGNFTGGGINAITRSGTNEVNGSIYYVYRNENLVGKSPTPLLKPGTTNVFERQKLTPFENKTFGFRVGGPIVKNKLFYFLNFEKQDDNRPQPFDPQTYRGTAISSDSITVLRNYLKNNYNYELGDFVNNPDQIKATRLTSKIDWNIDRMNQLSVSYRYNKAERTNPSRSSASAINFISGAEFFPSTTHSGTVELNSRFKSRVSNKLRVTYTDVVDDRAITGNPFPNVTIRDINGANIFLGSEASSTANLLKQSVLNIYDAVRVNAGAHSFSIGTDIDYNKTYNLFINRNYGAYEFASMNAFLTGGSPIRYRRGYSLVDNGKAGDESVNSAARFRTVRIGFFLNDDIKVNQNFTLTVGLRADRTEFLDRPAVDPFWRDTAAAIVGQYYDLKGAQSGQLFQPRWLVSPRVGFNVKFPDENLTIRGGIGLFAGRIPLVWPGGGFQNTGVTIGAIDISRRVSGVDLPIQFPNGNPVPFQDDVNQQYTAADFGATKVTPQGELNLVARDFKLPQVLRTSFGVDKRLGNGWTVTFEGIFTKNIHEVDWQNLLFNPNAVKTTTGPDARQVYDPALGTNGIKIPLRPYNPVATRNPYTSIILVKNTEGKKGFSYNFTVGVDKNFKNGMEFNANYTYGSSVVRNEATSSINSSNWNNMEAVNGRNYIGLTRSDFDLGHRITAYLSKKFRYANDKLATTVTLFYTGQSGSPFSYTMTSSIAGDGVNFNDLMYVPTKDELAQMQFVNNTVGPVTYTPDQQRALFDAYIESDKYLNKIRGSHAERNGARLPFTHILDLDIKQDFNFKVGKQKLQFQVIYTVSNFTNMLNKNWGRQYFVSFDQVNVLQFAGFATGTTTPRYRFSPVNGPANGKPFTISDGITPFNSSRWTSQLTFRFNF